MPDTDRLINKDQGDSIISAIQGITARLQEMYTVDDALSSTSENPVQNKVVKDALDGKVDKVSGKGLSTNDYTTADKEKLAGIEAGAQVNTVVPEDIESTQTATGNPLTLTDCAPINAESLVVELQPKQDLHGQQYPYVGGAGKNKLEVKAVTRTFNGITYTVYDDGTIKVNGTANGLSYLVLTNDSNDLSAISTTLYAQGMSLIGSTGVNGIDLQCRYTDGDYGTFTNGQTKTLGKNVALIHIQVDSGVTISNQIVKPMIRLSTETDPTFAPYSNICPITGYTQTSVEGTGKNLLAPTEYNGEYNKAVGGDLKTDSTAQQYSIDDNGTLSIVNTVEWHGRLFATGVLRQGNYIFPAQTFSDGNIRASILVTDEDLIVKRNIANRTNSGKYNSITITVADGERIAYVANANTAETFTITNFYLNKEDEFDEQYEPFQSTSATIQFGQTVYGGVSDFVEGGTDDNRNEVVFDGSSDETITEYSANTYRYQIKIDDYTSPAATVLDEYLICDKLKTLSKNDCATSTKNCISQSDVGLHYIIVKVIGITTLADFKTWLSNNPIQVVYEKATPTTLSTPVAPLKLLKGTNNLSADGVMQIGYQPDNVIGELKGMIQDLWDYVLTH